MDHRPRKALVFGNAEYRKFSRIPQSIKAASDISDVLTDLGFQVSQYHDCNHKAMIQHSEQFINQLTPNTIVFFFFVGHGIEKNNQQFCLPIDFDIGTYYHNQSAELRYHAFCLNTFVRAVGERAAILISVLDCCRMRLTSEERKQGAKDNKNRTKGRKGHILKPTKRVTSGIKKSTLIAFSCQPGTSAAVHRVQEYPFYTGHLYAVLKEPGLSVKTLFDRVRKNVKNADRMISQEEKLKQLPHHRNMDYFAYKDLVLNQKEEHNDTNGRHQDEYSEDSLGDFSDASYDDTSLDDYSEEDDSSSIVTFFKDKLSFW